MAEQNDHKYMNNDADSCHPNVYLPIYNIINVQII